jgi:stage III sporulation protein AA
MQMECAWNELLSILPQWMRPEVDMLAKQSGQEIRLRAGYPPQIVCKEGEKWLKKNTVPEDLAFCVNTASRYSPWASATSSQGYITAQGGHRIGLCGEVVILQGKSAGVKNPTSVCIRIARDLKGLINRTSLLEGSVLIIGQPGSGKTTLLRDLIRYRSERSSSSVAVVDERGELFPPGFVTGRRTDVLVGCNKREGVEMALRTMGPRCIAVDEITSQYDCASIQSAAWCGVSLLATAHASSVSDLKNREIYRPLMQTKLFQQIIVLQQDKSWTLERMGL